jgi:hypothetical protein
MKFGVTFLNLLIIEVNAENAAVLVDIAIEF